MAETAVALLPLLGDQRDRPCLDEALKGVTARALHPAARSDVVDRKTLAQIAHALARTTNDRELDVTPALRPTSADDVRHEGSRAYAWILDAPGLEVWLIEWGAATMLDLHDHGGASGAVEIIAGALVETYTTLGAGTALQSHRVAAGEYFSFGPDHVHEVWNSNSRSALSLHAYSPRLSSMTFYEHRDGVLGPPSRTERFDAQVDAEA